MRKQCNSSISSNEAVICSMESASDYGSQTLRKHLVRKPIMANLPTHTCSVSEWGYVTDGEAKIDSFRTAVRPVARKGRHRARASRPMADNET